MSNNQISNNKIWTDLTPSNSNNKNIIFTNYPMNSNKIVNNQ